ncbi:MAG TPA: SPFH domain-containing protein [Anaerolineales bacterium]|nr:SPFH domain-containing protein [Anaerolineales bacterium]HNH26401.1 SPFH domain-containing protein [Anaerolineales bacterium]HNM36862.1 SPFH domain-containing protein [Anaerolineales bacterium]
MNILVTLCLGGLGVLFLVLLTGIRFIPNNRIGIVEKRFGGKSLKSGLIAINGETGFQPQVLRGGLHYRMPIQYAIHIAPLVTITQGKIGYVFARDGAPLEPAQVLASNVTAHDFQDVTTFLKNGGQKGPQRLILREGTYAFNLMQFVVITEERVYSLPLSRDDTAVIVRMAEVIKERDGFRPVIIKDGDDKIGIVTVHDGPSLPQGEIIAPVVGDNPEKADEYHNKFQDADRFLKANGMRGRQLQVLVEGTYYINRLFATVEMIHKTIIDVGNVGVVVSYTGEQGVDLSGSEYRHGELVTRGQRGVWSEALLPGKYPFNTYAGKVIPVPTTNFILKWIKNEVGSHNFDENLTEVSLITKDAFEPSLPLSVVVHIDYKKAPLVIQRFGDIKRLVEQTLDPMVAAYFKNVAQTRTLIQLLQERSAIQQQSSLEMKEKFEHYNLELEEVLIGTPSSPAGDKQIETILTQLRQRQIAEEQVETYSQQEKAAVKERELREAESRAAMQTKMTEAELSISIQSNQGKAEYERSIQQAQQIRALAEAEAEKVARIGIAQALATEEQVRAYGGPQFQVTQQVLNRFAEAIQQSGVDVVPRVVVGGSNGENGGNQSANIMEGLLTMLLSERFGVSGEASTTQRSPDVEAMREKILKDMQKKDDTKKA